MWSLYASPGAHWKPISRAVGRPAVDCRVSIKLIAALKADTYVYLHISWVISRRKMQYSKSAEGLSESINRTKPRLLQFYEAKLILSIINTQMSVLLCDRFETTQALLISVWECMRSQIFVANIHGIRHFNNSV